MGISYRLSAFVPRVGFSARLHKLLHPENPEAWFRAHTYVFNQNSYYPLPEWKYKIDVFEGKGIGQEALEQACAEIEGGTYSRRSPWISIRLGDQPLIWPYNELLSMEIIISPTLFFLKEELRTRDWQAGDSDTFELLILLRGNSDVVQDNNYVRPMLGFVLEKLQPRFAMSYTDTFLDYFMPKPVQHDKPWLYYWQTMVYGPELVNDFGLDFLRKTPAFRLIELEGPLIWISSPSGIGNERFSTHPIKVESNLEGYSVYNYEDPALKRLFEETLQRHRSEVVDYLSLEEVINSR